MAVFLDLIGSHHVHVSFHSISFCYFVDYLIAVSEVIEECANESLRFTLISDNSQELSVLLLELF